MCETNAYLKGEGSEELFLESLARVEVDGDMLYLTSIFGDKKTVNGRILEINFQGGKIIIERV
jgi:predicted RNA-binding protein